MYTDISISLCNNYTLIHILSPIPQGKNKGLAIRLGGVGLREAYPPGGRLSLLSARPVVTFPAAKHHRPRPVPSYTAWLQRHIGANNLPKVVTQLMPGVGFEPTTC